MQFIFFLLDLLLLFSIFLLIKLFLSKKKRKVILKSEYNKEIFHNPDFIKSTEERLRKTDDVKRIKLPDNLIQFEDKRIDDTSQLAYLNMIHSMDSYSSTEGYSSGGGFSSIDYSSQNDSNSNSVSPINNDGFSEN